MHRLHPAKGGYDMKIFFAMGRANVIERLIDLRAQYHCSIASNPNPKITDITKAIAVYQKLTDLIPQSDTKLPGVLFNLGNSFLRRFKHTLKDIADISSAILSFHKAIQLSPDEPEFCHMLVLSLSFRFMHKEDFEDISEAILSYHNAIDLISNPQHPGLPGMFNNLGTSLLSQYKYIGDPKDLSEGIEVFRSASNNGGRSSLPASGKAILAQAALGNHDFSKAHIPPLHRFGCLWVSLGDFATKCNFLGVSWVSLRCLSLHTYFLRALRKIFVIYNKFIITSYSI